MVQLSELKWDSEDCMECAVKWEDYGRDLVNCDELVLEDIDVITTSEPLFDVAYSASECIDYIGDRH